MIILFHVRRFKNNRLLRTRDDLRFCNRSQECNKLVNDNLKFFLSVEHSIVVNLIYSNWYSINIRAFRLKFFVSNCGVPAVTFSNRTGAICETNILPS